MNAAKYAEYIAEVLPKLACYPHYVFKNYPEEHTFAGEMKFLE